MQKLTDEKRNLPPLNALKLFETAAYLNSFSATAEELGITHGAVSRQFKLLLGNRYLNVRDSAVWQLNMLRHLRQKLVQPSTSLVMHQFVLAKLSIQKSSESMPKQLSRCTD
ncbi:LysR family transcriptional regulator [Providencia alcalifaciens]|uniref:LysR family transcriptional regulator n=1 Tax=Providencia alcalifaciens TaxID=126385 RepID=A0AAW9VF10_9GAMM|nr:LysR family transcriptional regulator [Providencia alcalifaciens]